MFHLLTVEALEAAFLSLSRKAAAGVDGIRWMDYAGNMKNNITDLHRRLHQGSYRAQPGRRHYIPKADGKQRPLGIASLEDKIVQYALVKILNAVYENDFMGFSYGFRPRAKPARCTGRTGHRAGTHQRKLGTDADISQFFDRAGTSGVIRFAGHRMAAGGNRGSYVSGSSRDVGGEFNGEQRRKALTGAVSSPLLANICLHNVFDLWAHQWRR
ncbi:reverse transcriptase domain-containing protein [Klebsiella pneumoniae]|nr:reverse transcriptase domain-containing protein [Klebsiella pneumoniae]